MAEEGEVRYGDKGYFGAGTKGYDAAMRRATGGHPLGIFDLLRNERISKKRSPVERCFSVMKTVFRAGQDMSGIDVEIYRSMNRGLITIFFGEYTSCVIPIYLEQQPILNLKVNIGTYLVTKTL